MSQRKVLLVEDDYTLASVLQRNLRRLNHSLDITAVASVEDAENELSHGSFELIIADYALCGLYDGLDLWKWCKDKFPKTAFVMISGLPVQDYLSKVSQYSSVPKFLHKPFSMSDFADIIKEYV